MKKEILQRIQELGGNINHVKGTTLAEDLIAITFNTVLYRKPTDTPWQTEDEGEPIYGIADFINENEALFSTDKTAFYQKITDKYYQITQEGYGQVFWTARPFTPFKAGTEDFEEWNDEFIDGDVDLSEVLSHTNDPQPDFIQVFYSYGFPDHYYIALSDPDPENPTLFGTDHEVFFSEVTNKGKLEDFLNACMTKTELIAIIARKIEQ